MKNFTVKIYELEEAFFNTLMFMENKEEAKMAFAEMLNSDDAKFDYMVEYLGKNNEFYTMISDEIRRIWELDASAYYMESQLV